MRIIFFGNADFGLNTFIDLIESPKHDILALVTNPDKSVKRSKVKEYKPLKKTSLSYNVPVIEQDNLLDENFLKKIKNINADIFLVIAYKILPESVYNIPKYGAINLHASLLPQYRGAAPIHRALINGDDSTGLSTFFINNKVDKGKIIYQEKVPIFYEDNFHDLWLRLSQKGPKIISTTLDLIQKGICQPLSHSGKESYAAKIDKGELVINWNEKSSEIYNKIRAFSPYPCMYTFFKNIKIKIISSDIGHQFDDRSISPGSLVVSKSRLFVKCADSLIEILSLQPDSKRVMNSQDFINGFINKVDFKENNVFG
tara:strand:+ start:631 stop:1572 length:942 start_codon:yes stop_codon:yes gene_type:complete